MSVIEDVHKYTGLPKDDIKQVLDSLNIVVRNKISNGEKLKMKLFSGLTISSEFIPKEKFNVNLDKNIKSNFILNLSADFSKRFKCDIRNQYQKNNFTS